MHASVVRCYALTKNNVDITLNEIRPYLKSDGGNVKVHSVKNKTVKLILQGNCSTCPSSSVTMTKGIVALLKTKYPEIKQIIEMSEDGKPKMETTEENIILAVADISVTIGNCLSFISYKNNIIKLGITIGPSSPISLRLSIGQKIRTLFNVTIVQIVNT